MGSEKKIVFLVGAGRSGTTWLQLLLYQHSNIATAQETHLFSQYLSLFERSWKRHNDTPRKIGLPGTLSREEFDKLLRSCAMRVFASISSKKEHTKVVVEKTPNHIRYSAFILRLFPDAYFLHMIRDPRSVVSSMKAAGSSWGWRWAPINSTDAATSWARDVRVGRQIPLATGRYKEVFYEKLLSDGPSQLQEIFEWLELDVDHAFCKEAISACSINNLKDSAAHVRAPWAIDKEPSNFYRQGLIDSWRTELSRSELRIVEYIAGELMSDFGYVRVTSSSLGKPLPLIFDEAKGEILQHLVRMISRTSPRLRRTIAQMWRDAS